MKKLLSLFLVLCFFSTSLLASQDFGEIKKVEKQDSVVKQQSQADFSVIYCHQFAEVGFESPNASIDKIYWCKIFTKENPKKTARPHEDPGRYS